MKTDHADKQGARNLRINKRRKEITFNIERDIIHEHFSSLIKIVFFIKFSFSDHIFYEEVYM